MEPVLPTQSVEPPIVTTPRRRWFLAAMISLGILAAVGISLLSYNVLRTRVILPADAETVDINISSVPTPTPYPFREMTIPGLRERAYISEITQKNQLSQNGSYTSYIATYTSDGLNINGLLTIPQGEAPDGGWPAVVFVHGYIPPAQYQTTGQYAAYVDYLARNGMVVFKIDLRGHGSSEGEASGAYYSESYVIDTLNAYKALQKEPNINPDRIGLWGHSMAGNIVMRTMATLPEIPATVIWAGAVYTYTDMASLGISDSSYQPPVNITQRASRRQEIAKRYGEPGSANQFWLELAPASYVSDIKGAIEIHHAVDDDVVNVEYSRNLDTLLTAAGIPHELYEYASGGHNISGASFNTAMQRTVDFFKSTL